MNKIIHIDESYGNLIFYDRHYDNESYYVGIVEGTKNKYIKFKVIVMMSVKKSTQLKNNFIIDME